MAEIDWHYLFFLLFAHHSPKKLDHTIRLSFRNKQLFICSRCTGIALGFVTVLFPAFFKVTIPLQFFIPLISILPLIAIIDWFTQSAKLRQSNTQIRVGSGFLLGVSEALGVLLLFYGFYFSFLITLGVAVIYTLSVYLIALKTKCLDSYMREMHDF
jgi:uncharacterized membrane protein